MLGVDDYAYSGRGCGGDVPPCLYGQSQCTDFASHRLQHDLGLSRCTRWGNGGDFASRAAADGYRVDDTPARGALMSFPGNPGHVGVVLEAPGGATCGSGVLLEDYNWAPCRYSQHCVPPSHGRFIHINDQVAPPPPPPPPPDPGVPPEYGCPAGSTLIGGLCYPDPVAPVPSGGGLGWTGMAALVVAAVGAVVIYREMHSGVGADFGTALHNLVHDHDGEPLFAENPRHAAIRAQASAPPGPSVGDRVDAVSHRIAGDLRGLASRA